jgi:hypothetical protein
MHRIRSVGTIPNRRSRRRYAQLRGLGTEAVNYATAVKAKALILLADFVDAGQDDGTIATRGNNDRLNVERPHISTITPQGTIGRRERAATLPEILGTGSQQARDAVREARKTRDALAGTDIDQLVANVNRTLSDPEVLRVRQLGSPRMRLGRDTECR